MKRIFALLLGLIVSAAMMVSCGTLDNEAQKTAGDKEGSNRNRDGVSEDADVKAETDEQKTVEVLTDDTDETSEQSDFADEEAADEKSAPSEQGEALEEEVEEYEELSDAETVELYAELMNGLTEEENMYVEARGTEIAMVYVFDEEYDEAMLEIMRPLLEEQMATEDFYETYLAMKAELPEMTALTVEFVTADNIMVYSQKYDDNYEVRDAVIEVEENTAYDGDDADSISDEEMVQFIVEYINESGIVVAPEGFDIDIYAVGNVIKIDMIINDETVTQAVEENVASFEQIITESFDMESLKEVVPSVGIDVTIMSKNGDVIFASELR